MCHCVIKVAENCICFRSEWWEGQNKRTGEVGEFPEIVFSLQPLRAAAVDSTAHTSGTKQTSQCDVEANSNKNALDEPLIDFGILASSCVGLMTNDDEPAKPSPFSHWTTFDSTSDLHQAAEENPVSSADVKITQDAEVSEASKTIHNCLDSSSCQTNSVTECTSVNFADRRHGMIDTGRMANFDYDAEVDISDNILLLPATSQTSVSEPCSPAHMTGIDNPDLLVTSDNVCFIDERDGHGLCHSLPANKMSDRLSWMTSASCENLDSGVVPVFHNNGLCSRAQFTEHLSKASSDSPVYVGGGSAPPVPPRDYPSSSHPAGDTACHGPPHPKSHTAHQHTEIHPIVQDGQRRSSTHYWLLPEKQRFDALPIPCGSDAEHISYVNVPDGKPGREKSAGKAAKPKQSLPPAAEISHSQMDDMMKMLDISMADQPLESMAEIQEKVDLIRMDVGFDAVTFEESLSALSLKHWSVEDAIQYIKVEHLFRLRIASRDICREALIAFQWDMQKAASCLVDRQPASSDHIQ